MNIGAILLYLFLLFVLADYLLRLINRRGFFKVNFYRRFELPVFVSEILLLVIAFRALLLEPFIIPSSSMVPNLLIGDYILVNKFSYGYGQYSFPLKPLNFSGRLGGREIKRGEIVVFRSPIKTDESYVKRIVGLPGDMVQVKNSVLYINGKALPRIRDRDYQFDNGDAWAAPQFIETIGKIKTTPPPENAGMDNQEYHSYHLLEMSGNNGSLDNTEIYIVPEGYYFGMGDNRDNSADSRLLAPLGIGYIPQENIIGRVAVVLVSFNTENKTSFLGWSLRLNRIFVKPK